jgi:hypothetical protein
LFSDHEGDPAWQVRGLPRATGGPLSSARWDQVSR